MTATADPNDPSTWPEIGKSPKEPPDVPDDTELGDVEPSPPPCEHERLDADGTCKCGWSVVTRDAASVRESRKIVGPLIRVPVNEGGIAAVPSFIAESGAAQEVSPPATGTSSDPRTGYLKQEEVSPPSPRQSPQDFITTHVSFPRATVFYLNEVIELMKGYAEQAEGDIRELKAALRWIPVEEKLPETTGQYLVWVCGIGDDGEMSRCAVEARFNAKFKVWTPHHGWLSQEVQGWLPMLKPPVLG